MGALAEQPATAGGTEAGGRQNPHKESCSRLEEESPGGPASPAQFLSMLVMEGREEPAPCAACGSGRPAGPEAHGGPRRARGGVARPRHGVRLGRGALVSWGLGSPETWHE